MTHGSLFSGIGGFDLAAAGNKYVVVRTLEDAISAANQYMNPDKQIYHNGINETD